MRYRAISASALRRPRAFVYHPVGRALSRGSSLHRGRCGQGRPGRERCMQRFEVGSEIGRLRSVLLHEPDLELTRLTPANVHELLFDEIMWVERAQLEHRAFAQVLRDRGVEVLLLGDLLAETLTEEAARKELLDRVVTIDAFGQSLAPDVREWFDSLPERELARYLIGGVIPEDLPFSPQGLVGASFQPTTFVLPPLPNQLFVRDTSACRSTRWRSPRAGARSCTWRPCTGTTRCSRRRPSRSGTAATASITTRRSWRAATCW